MNLTSLNIVLRCAKDDDTCTLKVADKPDILNLVYEAKSESVIGFLCWVDYYLFFICVSSSYWIVPLFDAQETFL